MMLRMFQAQRAASSPIRRWLSALPAHQVVGLPALSPTMSSGVIASWKVSEGGSYAAGDVICEVETDKATVDFEAQDDGIVAKILAEAGNEVGVGSPIMVIVEDEKDIGAFSDFEPPAGAPTPQKSQAAPEPAPAPTASASPPAPAPAPTPVAAAPAPAPPVAEPAVPPAAEGDPTLVFIRADAELPLVKGPLASIISQQKEKYHSKYGITGF